MRTLYPLLCVKAGFLVLYLDNLYLSLDYLSIHQSSKTDQVFFSTVVKFNTSYLLPG